MDNNENRMDMMSAGNDRQIQLVVNNNQEEDAINLGNVFHNMKQKKRIFAWVLVLCLILGICVPLLLYQFTKKPLTVSSVVILRYEAPVKEDAKDIREGKKTLEEAEFAPVSNLCAPDGMELDINKITSSYVLQTALDGMVLSNPITVSSLRSNITIRTILTEESQRLKESLAGLADAKSVDAYKQMQTAEMDYQNRFVVTLTNGFGEEDSRIKTELKDTELKQLLDRILAVYNEYLVRTYADMRLPEDSFSIIDTAELDVLDSLDQLRKGLDDLYEYCDEKTDTVKAYRSWQTGRSLTDWMETLQTFKSINVDYLYAMVSENAITRDKAELLTNWKYMLRMAKNDLEKTNENIIETKKLLATYKNDEVFISMQESDAAKSTKTATEYYNSLILQQTENYEKAAELKASIADYEDRILRLDAKTRTDVTAAVEEELARSISSAQALYGEIRNHMEEVFTSTTYSTFEDHSAAQGKEQSFITANIKKIVIAIILLVALGFGLWFLAGLAPELSKDKKVTESGKEAEAK